MLEVHAPHDKVHTWTDFFIHIATITIGLLIAIGLEQTVEYFHHRHQAREALDLLQRELTDNRERLAADMRYNALELAEHHADLAVLQRLRAHALRPEDRLVFVRPYEVLNASAWRIVHESAAATYLPYEVLAAYDEIYDAQQRINGNVMDIYADLQRATAVLNTEQPDPSQEEQDRVQRDARDARSTSSGNAQTFAADFHATMARLSGEHDLSKLTPPEIDRLEIGFQEAITNDRRVHRLYVNLEQLYGKLQP